VKPVLILLFAICCGVTFAAEIPALPKEYANQEVNGWNVRINSILFRGDRVAGSNGFFPFVAGDLKHEEPFIDALIEEIRGKLP
jgi:hypothetical protein